VGSIPWGLIGLRNRCFLYIGATYTPVYMVVVNTDMNYMNCTSYIITVKQLNKLNTSYLGMELYFLVPIGQP